MTTQITEQASRVKRIKMSSILPNHTDSTGKITIQVIGSDKELSFFYHVPANLSDLLTY